jgi:hypothetical protein
VSEEDNPIYNHHSAVQKHPGSAAKIEFLENNRILIGDIPPGELTSLVTK